MVTIKYLGTTTNDIPIVQDHFLPNRALDEQDKIRFCAALACRPEISSFLLVSKRRDEHLEFAGDASSEVSEVDKWAESSIANQLHIKKTLYRHDEGEFSLEFPFNTEIIVAHDRSDRLPYMKMLSLVERDLERHTGSFPAL